MPGPIYSYPKEVNEKNRLWVRFKQVDFELDEASRLLTKGRNTPAVYLYLPGSISTADNLSYSDEKLDFFGRSVEAAIEGGALDASSFATRARQARDGIGAAFADGMEFVGNLIDGGAINAPAAIRILQRFPGAYNSTIGRGVRASTRYSANPHTRSLFDSVQLRDFSFSFELMPESVAEAREIERIIKFFRLIAYPEYTNVSDLQYDRPELEADEGGEQPDNPDIFSDEAQQLLSTFTYKFPSMVKVDMFYMLGKDAQEILNNNPEAVQRLQDQDLGSADDLSAGMIRVGPRLQYCHIESVGTTYDPNGTQAYLRSGNYAAPPATKLEVKVKEDRALHRGMIKAGY